MTESIYQELILDHYKHPRNFGKLSGATAKFVENPSCGDEVTMYVVVKEGIIKGVSFEGTGCVVSIASASLLTDHIKGKKLADLKKLGRSTILKLLGIELGPTRLKCALLPLEALQQATGS